jgi:hypothetical protein
MTKTLLPAYSDAYFASSQVIVVFPTPPLKFTTAMLLILPQHYLLNDEILSTLNTLIKDLESLHQIRTHWNSETGEGIYNLRPDFDFFIGPVRKLFSVGLGTSFDCYRRIDSPSFCAVEIFSPLQTEGAIVRRLEKEF